MQLKKYGLNLISVTALGIGSVVGAGIFALLGQVIMMAGDQTYYAFIIAGVAALFSGYSYSRLAAAYPDSGGLTDYFHIAFKKRWVVGTFSLIYMMTSAVSICMMAKSFGIYAVKLFPHVQDTNFFINAAACFLIVGLAALNMQRSKDVGNTEIVMVSIKMGILLSLIIAALIHYDIAEKMQTIPFNEVKFMGSIGVTFFCLCRLRCYYQCCRRRKKSAADYHLGHFFDYSYRYWLVSCSGFCRFALYSGQGTYGERGYCGCGGGESSDGRLGVCFDVYNGGYCFYFRNRGNLFQHFSNLICLIPATYSSGILSPSVLATGNLGKSAHCVADAGGNAVV